MLSLTRKEKRTAWISGFLLLCLGAYGFLIKPAKARIATLRRVLPEQQQQLQELQTLVQRYHSLQCLSQDQPAGAGRDRPEPNAALLPALEALIQTQGLSTHLESLEQSPMAQSSAQVVDIRLNNVNLEQLVDLLSRIDAPDMPARITMLHVSQSPGTGASLDATIRAAQFVS